MKIPREFKGVARATQNDIGFLKPTPTPAKPPTPSPREWGGRFSEMLPATAGVLTNILSRDKIPGNRAALSLWRSAESIGAGNANVRAVITYGGGLARKLIMKCDWGGVVELLGDEISVDFETYQPDSTVAYAPYVVDIAATVALDLGASSAPARYTVEPARVVAAATRTIDVPARASRVGLLVRYGEAVGAPADAPLGQVFLSFSNRAGASLGFIDSANARDGLFGNGVPIPTGTVQVIVSNRSTFYLDLGAVFHLAA